MFVHIKIKAALICIHRSIQSHLYVSVLTHCIIIIYLQKNDPQN